MKITTISGGSSSKDLGDRLLPRGSVACDASGMHGRVQKFSKGAWGIRGQIPVRSLARLGKKTLEAEKKSYITVQLLMAAVADSFTV